MQITRRTLFTALAIALTALLAASSWVAADAQGATTLVPRTIDAYVTDARPAQNRLLTDLWQRADYFWARRGVTTCPADRVELDIASDMYVQQGDDHADALGLTIMDNPFTAGQSCRVFFDTNLLAVSQADPTDLPSARMLCAVVYHEAGHTGLLEHTDGGVMNATADGKLTNVPWECRVWARDRARVAKAARAAKLARSRQFDSR